MASAKRIMSAKDLSESDWAILDELAKGRCTPGALADWTELSTSAVHDHLRDLRWAEYVEKVHSSGLYELVEYPEEES